MTIFLIVLHVLVCVFLILFVLLQPGARGGVGAAFGGAGGQTVFGGRGANTFLAKLTAAAAVIFMLTSISLSFFASRGTSVMGKRASTPPPATAPAADGSAPATDAPAGDAASGAAGSDAAAGTDKPAGDAPPAPTAPPPAAPAPATP
jgi:preprotein translocase subunit SecG